MAAQHWEARRKQMVMERRLRLMQESRISEEIQQQASRDSKQNPCIPTSSNMVSQDLSQKEFMQDRCLCNTEHVPNQSGKLLKRYTSLDYVQQW